MAYEKGSGCSFFDLSSTFLKPYDNLELTLIFSKPYINLERFFTKPYDNLEPQKKAHTGKHLEIFNIVIHRSSCFKAMLNK